MQGCLLCTIVTKNTGNFLPSLYKGLLYNTSISVPSKSPSAWCHKYWIHWRAVKSALSVEKQLREITSKLKQVKKYTVNHSDASLYLRFVLKLGQMVDTFLQ